VTLGVFNASARQLLADLGSKISISTDEARETSYLFQRISVSVQRFSAVLLHKSSLAFVWLSQFLSLLKNVLNLILHNYGNSNTWGQILYGQIQMLIISVPLPQCFCIKWPSDWLQFVSECHQCSSDTAEVGRTQSPSGWNESPPNCICTNQHHRHIELSTETAEQPSILPVHFKTRRHQVFKYTGWSKKTAQSFRHHNFATVHHRVLRFSAKSSERNSLLKSVFEYSS